MSGRRGNTGSEGRRSNFKFNAMTNDEFRRRREETTVEIRKAKREDSLNKRRNMNLEEVADEEYVTEPMTPVASGIPASTPMAPYKGTKTSIAAELASRLPELSQALYSPEVETRFEATVAIRKAVATENNPPIDLVINAGLVPRLVEILSGKSYGTFPEDSTMRSRLEDLQLEAAWVLTNIASGKHEETMYVVECQAVPVFIAFLRHERWEIREQCIWALGNIAGDGIELRNYVLTQNIMSPLLENIEYCLSNDGTPATTLATAAWLLSNLCRGSEPPAWNEIAPALPTINRLLQVNDLDTLVDTCWALSYLTTETTYVEHVVNAGIVPFLVPRLAYRIEKVQVPALRAVGNIVTGDQTQTQAVIDAGALPLLRNLLSSATNSIIKETCWAISNITAGTPEQIQAVIDANIIPPLIRNLSTGSHKIKKEACWALCNATTCHMTHPEQTKYLVEQGIIPPLCNLFTETQESRIYLIALDGLNNILAVGQQIAELSPDTLNPYVNYVEECGALEAIFRLQDHPETDIYLKAKAIIDNYFGGEEYDLDVDEDGDEFSFNTKPQVPQGGFNFA